MDMSQPTMLHSVQRQHRARSAARIWGGRDLSGSIFTLSAVLACGAPDRGATPGAPPAAVFASTVRGPVCPSCTRPDVVGTETSDFGGSESACTGDRAPLPTAPDALSEVNRLREAYAGPLAHSMRWGSGRGFDAGGESSFFEAPPDGYDPETRVNIDVVLGDTEYFVGRPIRGEAPIECPDWFEVPATVALSTEDGAIEVTAEGRFRTAVSGRFSRLTAYADLADTLGTLDLHLDPGRAYRGRLTIDLNALNEGTRGFIELSVASAALPRGLVDYPLEARFPDDGCSPFVGFPIAADAPLSWAGGLSAAQVIDDWREALAPLRVPAVWGDCGLVDSSFVLGAPLRVCAGSTVDGRQALMDFDTQSRFVTSDGRIDMAVTRGGATPMALSLSIPDPVERIPAADFAARTGIVGVDPGNSPWLQAGFAAQFRREGTSIVADGLLAVEGLDCDVEDCSAFLYRETLAWPPDGWSAPYCQ
jgi:hypothetical protein